MNKMKLFYPYINFIILSFFISNLCLAIETVVTVDNNKWNYFLNLNINSFNRKEIYNKIFISGPIGSMSTGDFLRSKDLGFDQKMKIQNDQMNEVFANLFETNYSAFSNDVSIQPTVVRKLNSIKPDFEDSDILRKGTNVGASAASSSVDLCIRNFTSGDYHKGLVCYTLLSHYLNYLAEKGTLTLFEKRLIEKWIQFKSTYFNDGLLKEIRMQQDRHLQILKTSRAGRGIRYLINKNYGNFKLGLETLDLLTKVSILDQFACIEPEISFDKLQNLLSNTTQSDLLKSCIRGHLGNIDKNAISILVQNSSKFDLFEAAPIAPLILENLKNGGI